MSKLDIHRKGVVGSYSFNTDTGCGCVTEAYIIYFPVVKSSDPIIFISRLLKY